MTKKTERRKVSGWIILDKPQGLGSTQALGRVRHWLRAEKGGHAGTLDPMATGILPLAFGEATKTIPFIQDATKEYEFTLRFGQATDSEDAEGRVIAESPARPDDAAIRAALPRFIGDITQIPPRFSALKIDGQRAYDLARAGAEFEVKPRQVRIDGLTLIDRPDADHARFHVRCGKGTYVRSLGRDLAHALGTLGHLTALRRTRVGPFGLDRAILLEKLQGISHTLATDDALLPLATALDGIPALAVTEEEALRLRHGQAISLTHRQDMEGVPPLTDAPDGVILAVFAGAPLALLRADAAELRPFRAFNPMPME